MKSPRILFWHRKDLRVNDNKSLMKSLEISHYITSIYIFDSNSQLDFNAESRKWFLGESLKELSQSWRHSGSRMIVDEGEPIKLIPKIAKLINAKFVAWNKGIEPYEIRRDFEVKNELQRLNINVLESLDHLLMNPSKIFTGNGNPYTVYGPFYKNLKSKLIYQNFKKFDLSDLKFIDLEQNIIDHPLIRSSSEKLEKFAIKNKFIGKSSCPCKPGEKAADKLLNNFLSSKKISNYEKARDFPAQDGTSYLSASLRFGTISIRRIWDQTSNLAMQNQSGLSSIETWKKELLWREFYQHCLFHFPELANGPYRQKWLRFPWQNNQKWFTRWCNGETGVPIIDAAMRQLNHSGWMHNRCRMIVASFLVKDLICNWQMGEKKFMQFLVDGDLAANNGGWQWSASSGMDPKPLRIFNPFIQTKKFDPICEYIRFWVPELSKIPDSEILNGEISQIGSISYPQPIVNHNIQQRLFKSLYAEI